MFKQKQYSLFETGFIQTFDLVITHLRIKIDSNFLDKFFILFGNIDKSIIINSLAVTLLVYSIFQYGEIEWLLYVILQILISDSLCSYLLKKNIKRYRPAAWFFGKDHEMTPGLEYRLGIKERKIFDKFTGYVRNSHASMCSSHAANYFGFSLIIAELYSIQNINFYIPFLLVGIGRWYIGAHWFSDILVGWIIGAGSFLIIKLIFLI